MISANIADYNQLQQAIIGTILTCPDHADIAAGMLIPEDFSNQKCRVAFQYLIENENVDLVVAEAALKGKVKGDELVSWVAQEFTPSFLPYYCRELKEQANKTRLFDEIGRVRLMAQNNTAAEMLDQLEGVITQMSSPVSSEPELAKRLVLDAAKRLQFRFENKGTIQGIPYGWDALDAATCGMHKGELIIVAGRPSMGKSAFACNILENVCKAGFTGMLFSLEMDKGNVIDRMLSSRGHVPYERIRSGNFQPVDWARQTRASEEVAGYRLLIDDTPAISFREIKSKARKQKRDGLDVIVIDYLQLIPTAAKESRTLAIGELSRGFKQMARELECSVVLLSQLNRAVDSRNDKRPMMSDLRDSGEIEQDADVIIFPFRPAAYCQKCKDKVNEDGGHDVKQHQKEAEIIIEKQRNGERNISVKLEWEGYIQRFIDTTNNDY